ncbi:MAG TPA: MFS transporter [Chthoniobacterales bacterium]
MTRDLPAAPSPAPHGPSDETRPLLRQRATAAEIRLTAAEWGLLSVLTLMQFCVTLDFIIIAPLGPQLMRVFGIDTEQFGYTVAAYAFGAGLASFSAAFFLDRFDRKRALLVLFAGFTVGTFGCALAPGYHAMLAARFATGIFGGVCGGVVLAIVGDAIPEVRRATAMGTVMSAFALASALGVPAGLWMAERGWHWPFLILGTLSAVIIPFALWLLPRSDRHLRRAASAESAGARMWAVLANGRHLRAFSLMAALTTAGFMVVPFISTFMVRNVGMTESQLKFNFLSGGLCTLFSMNLIGRLADMYGRWRLFAIMAILSSAAVLWLTHLTSEPLLVAIGVTTVFMVTMTGRFVPAIAMITGSAEARHRGGFMSLNSCVQQTFSGLGTSLGGYLIIDQAHQPLRNYGLIGWIAAGIAIGCIGLASPMRRPETGPNRRQPRGGDFGSGQR